jgi:hypothetical protein
MNNRSLRARFVARRNLRALDRAMARAARDGGISDLHAQSRRL